MHSWYYKVCRDFREHTHSLYFLHVGKVFLWSPYYSSHFKLPQQQWWVNNTLIYKKDKEQSMRQSLFMKKHYTHSAACRNPHLKPNGHCLSLLSSLRHSQEFSLTCFLNNLKCCRFICFTFLALLLINFFFTLSCPPDKSNTNLSSSSLFSASFHFISARH